MDLRMFAACLIMTVFLIKHSDAQITGFTETGFTVSAGTGTIDVTMTYDTAVPENTAAGSAMFSLTAQKTGGAALTYAFASGGNPDSIAAITETGEVASINVAAGVTLDYETKTQYVLTIEATEASTTPLGTATVTINIGDIAEFSKGQFGACIGDGSTAGAVVGTYALSPVASGTTIAYSITNGNTNTEFKIGTTGEISLDTGKTVDQATLGGYTLDIKGNDGTNDLDTAKVWISVQDSCSGAAVQIAAALGIIVASLATMHFV